jgi:hypothetical protein
MIHVFIFLWAIEYSAHIAQQQETNRGFQPLPPCRIPGTTPFDGEQAKKGYALNKMCFSFNTAENRAAFLAGRRGLHAPVRPERAAGRRHPRQATCCS